MQINGVLLYDRLKRKTYRAQKQRLEYEIRKILISRDMRLRYRRIKKAFGAASGDKSGVQRKVNS